MRRRTVILAALILAAGAAAYVVIDPNAQFGKRQAAEKIVRARLKDPDAAKFSDVTIQKVGGAPYSMCGYVNGKNEFGAYTGPRRFYVAFGQPSSLFIVPDAAERGGEDYSAVESMMSALCSADSTAVMKETDRILGR